MLGQFHRGVSHRVISVFFWNRLSHFELAHLRGCSRTRSLVELCEFLRLGWKHCSWFCWRPSWWCRCSFHPLEWWPPRQRAGVSSGQWTLVAYCVGHSRKSPGDVSLHPEERGNSEHVSTGSMASWKASSSLYRFCTSAVRSGSSAGILSCRFYLWSSLHGSCDFGRW